MEPKAAIQEFLLRCNGHELCIDCIKCDIVPAWTSGHHILALISSGASIEAEQGLFLFKYTAEILSTVEQLTVETILPIKGDFKKYFVPIQNANVAQTKRANLQTSKVKVDVDFAFNSQAQNFFTRVDECVQANFEKIKRGISAQFHWIQRYQVPRPLVNQTRHGFDAFGMSTFNDFETKNHRQTVASTIYPARPAPKPPQPRSHSVHNPSAIQRDFLNPTATSAFEGGFFEDTYAMVDSTYATMTSENRLSASDASVERNPYANLAATPPKNLTAEEELSEYIHPTPPKPRQVTTNDEGTETAKDALRFDDEFYHPVQSNKPPHLPPRPYKQKQTKPSSTFYMDQVIADGPGDEYSEVTAFTGSATPFGIREEVLKRREKDYTYLEPFRIFIGTWNVNGQNAAESLSDWLMSDGSPPHIYAIGFQELDLSKEAFLFNDSVREEEWRIHVEKYLHSDGKYTLVRLVRLVGMMLLVYVREGHKRFVKEDITDTVGTGIMGKMGNKGGVAVRLMFHNTSFCFINSHLAAHLDEFERRNQDYNDICQRMKFEKADEISYQIREHDFVVWMGDLNYRISDLPLEVVTDKIEKRDFRVLLEHDQLNKQLELQKVFHQYVEGQIGFKPTYKFDPGTNDYDTSEKQRIPAWCDRILFLGSIGKQLVYRSHDSLLLSDHKPVSSLFEVQVKVVDETKFRKVVEQEIRKVDRRENEALPQLSISTNEFHIGDVHFMDKKKLTLDVANVGQVDTGFSFVNKLDEKYYCKPWMRIQPHKGFIPVGEFKEIKIYIEVNKQTACFMNSGQDTLDDILILRLDNGKDYYITVNGTYKPSCFGASIETLVRMVEPIREMKIEEIKRMEQTDWSEESESDISTEKFDIPKEIWMMVDFLFRNGLETEELFSKGGFHEELVAIRETLDNGVPETMPGSIYSIGEALMLFLECLKEPVIPYEFYHKCLEASNNYTLCKQVLKRLPRSHRNVFKYLAAFIRELLLHNDDNKLDQKTLATLFGELFMRTPPNEKEKESQMSASNRRTLGQQRSRKKASFVYQFIINEYDE